MQLTYAVLGSGSMGLRFGLLLKEHLGAQVDFIDTWEEHIKTVTEQGGVYRCVHSWLGTCKTSLTQDDACGAGWARTHGVLWEFGHGKAGFPCVRPDNPMTRLMGFPWRQSRKCVAIRLQIHTGGVQWGSHLSSLIVGTF